MLSELAKNPVEGFSAGLADDANMFEWFVPLSFLRSSQSNFLLKGHHGNGTRRNALVCLFPVKRFDSTS